MMHLEYNPFSTKSIAISFNCPKCNCLVEDEIEGIPYPNLDAEKDTHSATASCDDEIILCQECNKEFNISLCSSICGGFLSSEDLPDDTEFEIENIEDEYFESYSETIQSNTSYFETFKNQMENLRILINTSNILNENILETMKKLIFSNIVTCLEMYLSDALINNITDNKKYMENFVNNFEDYKNKKLSFNNICKEYNKLETTVKNDLLNLMYHNIPKIKGIYESTFKIKFPEIKTICQIVSIRHDLVHRNGKTKNGDLIQLDKEKLEDVYNSIYSFIEEIDNQLVLSKDDLF